MDGVTSIGGPSKKHKRSEADFYPTPPECTHALLDFLKLDPKLIVWEPACGDGAISIVLEQRGYSVNSTDLRIDSGYGVGGVDFLTSEKKGDILFTNPPFNLSVEFINRCFELDLMLFALILKATYWHSLKRVNLFNRTNPRYVLPFTWRPNMCPERGSSPTMDFMTTVWVKDYKGPTEYKPLEKSILY
jgi:hypothetical protein